MALFDFDPAAANSGFADVLDSPAGRAALLQFGISLLSPQYGNTTAGVIGNALGSAGEAIGRVNAQDLRERESDSKIAKREADVSTQQGKLDAAADRQRGRDDYLNFREQKQASDDENRKRALGLQELFGNRRAGQQDQQSFDRRAKADAEYILSALQAEEKAKNDVLTGRNFKPNPALDPYRGAMTLTDVEARMQKDPAMYERYKDRLTPPQQIQVVPPSSPSLSPNNPNVRGISGTVEESGNVTYPTAPADVNFRKPGQIYQTPKGPLEWTGQGWRPIQA